MANPVAFVEEIDEDEFEEEEYDEDDDFDGAEFDDYEAGDEEDDEEDEEDEDGLDGSEAADAPQDGVQGEVDDAHRLQEDAANAAPFVRTPQLEDPTWQKILAIAQRLTDANIEVLTLLFVGRVGNGRSSTINSLLGDSTAAPVQQIPSGGASSTLSLHVRQLEKPRLLLRFVDSPDLLSGGSLDVAALERLSSGMAGRSVTALVLVERLDVMRIEPLDRQLWQSLSRYFGRQIWRNVVVALTHASAAAPDGFEGPGAARSYAERREAQLAAALRPVGAAAPRFVYVENSSRCPRSADGERALFEGSLPWVSHAWDVLADQALAGTEPCRLAFQPYNPNRRRLWLIPLALAIQFALYRFVAMPVVEADAWKGDKNGLFDETTAREERLRAQERKQQREEERQEQQRIKRIMSRRTVRPTFVAAPQRNDADDDDDDDDV